MVKSVNRGTNENIGFNSVKWSVHLRIYRINSVFEILNFAG